MPRPSCRSSTASWPGFPAVSRSSPASPSRSGRARSPGSASASRRRAPSVSSAGCRSSASRRWRPWPRPPSRSGPGRRSSPPSMHATAMSSSRASGRAARRCWARPHVGRSTLPVRSGQGPLRLIGRAAPPWRGPPWRSASTTDIGRVPRPARHRLRGAARRAGRSRDRHRAPALPQGARTPRRHGRAGSWPPRAGFLSGTPCSDGPAPATSRCFDGDRAADCARLHATGFPHPWDALDFERLIGAETSFGHAAVETRDPRRLAGFILSRRAADEAEVLTIVVDPASRRQGIAGRLMQANMEVLARTGVKSWFLEVGETNAAARKLYAGLGFAEVGRRQGYYRVARQPARDGADPAARHRLAGRGGSPCSAPSMPNIRRRDRDFGRIGAEKP